MIPDSSTWYVSFKRNQHQWDREFALPEDRVPPCTYTLTVMLVTERRSRDHGITPLSGRPGVLCHRECAAMPARQQHNVPSNDISRNIAAY